MAKLQGKAAKKAVTKALTGKATGRTLPPAVKVPATGTITILVKNKAYRSAHKAKMFKLAQANNSVAKFLAAGGGKGDLSRMARWGVIAVK